MTVGIQVIGYFNLNTFALMRLLSNGQRDPSFGTNGLVLRTLNSTLGVQLNNVVVLPGGKYLACGGFNGNHALERYNSDGSIDGTYTAALMDFGSDREHCGTLLMQGTKPLVGGRSFALVRYTEAGAVDTTFGTNGLVHDGRDAGRSAAGADGKIWMVGSVTKLVGGNDNSYLKQVLLSADGVPEASFVTNGVLGVEYSVSHVRASRSTEPSNAAEAMAANPSPDLSATLSPSDGERDGVRGPTTATRRKQITLATSSSEKFPPEHFLTPTPAANYILVSVRDCGSGISQEIKSRIFEPFFTTKSLSTKRGTGLGLSIVYELAKKMDAGLAVESNVGQGSTFTLILPVQATTKPITTDGNR